jgi:hypothetical protein
MLPKDDVRGPVDQPNTCTRRRCGERLVISSNGHIVNSRKEYGTRGYVQKERVCSVCAEGEK